MSVTIDGIKGYEYQYKVTVLISLLYSAEKTKLFVEKKGSEDALLIIKNNELEQTIEIQVKRENNLIDIPKLVNWLSHFPERKSDSNLLQRLFDNKNSFALFVSHSRCSDNIVKFKTDLSKIEKHTSISYSNEWRKEFSESLKNQKFTQKTLKKSREQYCQNQSENFYSRKNIAQTLDRCLILEEFTDAKVDNYITLLLNSKFGIAQSRTTAIYLELLEIVRNGRDIGTDIYGKIRKHIENNKIGIPIIDSLYKTRNEEKQLIKKLEKEGVLLLSGASQCGKTELAKKISTHFVNKGYDYKIYDDISELKRYFSSNVKNNKIAILEDPFGHITLKENHSEIFRKLKELLANIEKHHSLIVSSRIEILYDIFDSTNIDDCKIKNHNWSDLTIKDNVVVKSFWEFLAKTSSFPNNIIELVSQGILDSRSEDLLQIGQLNYLINEEIDNLSQKKFVDLEHAARRDSKEIAVQLKQSNEYAANILSLISICSTPIQHIDFTDLAYILSNIDNFLSVTEKKFFTSSFGNDKAPAFPEYPVDLELSKEILNTLDYLEERQFISILEKSILLTHPNYYEAGRYLFFDKGTIKQKRKLEQYKKCIACLNPTTAYQASKNYLFIFDKIKKELKDEIFNIAFLGLNSIFPSIEDSSLIFLMNFIQEFDDRRSQEIINKIQGGGTSSSDIYWHDNEIPFISNTGGILNFWVEYDSQTISKVENQLSIGLLPTSHDSWLFIESLKNGQIISFDSLKILLQNNEAFIRSKLIYQIFSRLKIENKDLINEIFQDEHPSVIYNAIRASILNWFNFPQELKDLVFDLIKTSLEKYQISIRAYNFISTFSIDYGEESIIDWKDYGENQKKELWNLWGKIYPIVIQKVPLDVYTNSARFGATMDDAIKYLDIDIGVNVLKEWLNRIDYQIKNNRVLDEFEMAIADNLMQLTGNHSSIRKEIYSQLINYNNISFLLSNIKWIINYWDDLSQYEQKTIIDLVHSERIDVRWVKAVLLNSYNPPEEICFHILGEKEIFKQKPEYILSKFSNQLLRGSLNVYCGFPQPLWWLAVNHNNKEFWDKIIRHILLDENHAGFDICLEEFIRYGVNGFSGEWKNWEELWANICLRTKNKKLLFECLLYNTADCTCNLTTTKKLWSQLIDSYAHIGKQEEVEALIIENFELLQQTGHKEDIFKIFDKDFLFDKIVKKLIPDGFLITILDSVSSFKYLKETEIVKLINSIIEFTKLKDIRFFGTFIFIEKILEEERVPKEVVDALKQLPNVIDIVGKEELEKKKRFNYKLENWIGIN